MSCLARKPNLCAGLNIFGFRVFSGDRIKTQAMDVFFNKTMSLDQLVRLQNKDLSMDTRLQALKLYRAHLMSQYADRRAVWCVRDISGPALSRTAVAPHVWHAHFQTCPFDPLQLTSWCPHSSGVNVATGRSFRSSLFSFWSTLPHFLHISMLM